MNLPEEGGVTEAARQVLEYLSRASTQRAGSWSTTTPRKSSACRLAASHRGRRRADNVARTRPEAADQSQTSEARPVRAHQRASATCGGGCPPSTPSRPTTGGRSWPTCRSRWSRRGRCSTPRACRSASTSACSTSRFASAAGRTRAARLPGGGRQGLAPVARPSRAQVPGGRPALQISSVMAPDIGLDLVYSEPMVAMAAGSDPTSPRRRWWRSSSLRSTSGR